MKKYKNPLLFSLLVLLLTVLLPILIFFMDIGLNSILFIALICLFILIIWFLGMVSLLCGKDKINKIASKLLVIGNAVSCLILLSFGGLYILTATYPYTGDFSIETPLFDNKNVMIIVPHQDDDINLVGGLIEQYTQGNSDVTIVFTTNGDYLGKSDLRAAEALAALTSLGVKKESIYYLGFGDQWLAQNDGEKETTHIYNSPDPDSVWTSHYGATATYGTQSIDCYLELPYTRNHYLHSLQSIIQEKMPDTIFVTDFDSHADHRAAGLFFDEAICNILTRNPDYHPTVYSGFCYGTAWEATEDFYDGWNLLSTKKPANSTWDKSSYGYTWEDRIRFPLSRSNLNPILLNNSVYQSLNTYASQEAYTKAVSVLNGDKVFWERRTDSLLYDAEIFVDGEKTLLLNDFKLKDFNNISGSLGINVGFEYLKNKTVSIKLANTVTANCIYLYDNPSEYENVLEGYISFSDGSTITFSNLAKNGSATKISFPEKTIEWLEIVATKAEGNYAGLSEIELYYDVQDLQEDTNTYIMAVDNQDNFVYDYIVGPQGTAEFRLWAFPQAEALSQNDISLRFESEGGDASYCWDHDTLVVRCAKDSKCSITISTDTTSTTFTVSNPSHVTRAYLMLLRHTEQTVFRIKSLLQEVSYFLS